MATESPLVHDGSQTTAAANYSGGVTGLAGPNSSGQFLAVYISGSRAVSIAATAGQKVYGILQNTPASGQAADVGILGVTKAVAGSATINAGDDLMADASGRLILQTGTNVTVAVAIEPSGATNQIITVAIVPTARVQM
jgi:hypothetical protein